MLSQATSPVYLSPQLCFVPYFCQILTMFHCFVLPRVTPTLPRNHNFSFLHAQKITNKKVWAFYCKYSIKTLDRMRINGADRGTLACKSESACFKLWQLNNSAMDDRKIGTDIRELTDSVLPSFLHSAPWGSHFVPLCSSYWMSCNEIGYTCPPSGLPMRPSLSHQAPSTDQKRAFIETTA